jgi:hypothetical protein
MIKKGAAYFYFSEIIFKISFKIQLGIIANAIVYDTF